MTHTIAALLALLLLAGVPGCRPTFEAAAGNLMVADKPFTPSACSVLTHCTGIELSDAAGGRVVLTLPPARLNAWQDIGGIANVSVRPGPGEPETELGRCAVATLTGQGYHGGGRRAASGKVSLACPGPPAASGDLTFSGCF